MGASPACYHYRLFRGGTGRGLLSFFLERSWGLWGGDARARGRCTSPVRELFPCRAPSVANLLQQPGSPQSPGSLTPPSSLPPPAVSGGCDSTETAVGKHRASPRAHSFLQAGVSSRASQLLGHEVLDGRDTHRPDNGVAFVTPALTRGPRFQLRAHAVFQGQR